MGNDSQMPRSVADISPYRCHSGKQILETDKEADLIFPLLRSVAVQVDCTLESLSARTKIHTVMSLLTQFLDVIHRTRT